MHFVNKHDLNFMYHYMKRRLKNNISQRATSTQSIMNNSTNGLISSFPSTFSPTALHISIVVLLCGILFLGVFGNLIVVYIFGIKPGKKERKRFEWFLTILGIIDLITSFIIPTTFLYLTLTNYQAWDFGYIGCKTIPPLLQISISISQGVLIIISYERHQAIVHPFDRRLTTRHLSLCLILVVVISSVLAIPYAITLDIVNSTEFNVHTCLPRSDTQHLQLTSSCIYLARDILATSTMMYLYSRINRVLTKNYVVVTWDRASFSNKGRKLLKTVVIMFVVLTLPFDIFQVSALSMFVAMGNKVSSSMYEKLVVVNILLQMLQISNSVSNVFIYSKLHSKFQNVIRWWRVPRDFKTVEESVLKDNFTTSVRLRMNDLCDETDTASSCAAL